MLERKASWWTLAAIAAMGAAACIQFRASSRLTVRHSFPDIHADGRVQIVAELDATHLQQIEASEVTFTGKGADTLTTTPAGNGSLFVEQRAPVYPAIELFKATWRGQTVDIPVSFPAEDIVSHDAPGLPYWMPLHEAGDRYAFVRWFISLADRAAAAQTADLPPEISDCAALLRFCFREALRRHNDAWYAAAPELERITLPSVQQWAYPETPLQATLFRTRAGDFAPANLTDGTFAQFADAKTLATDNTLFISRNLRDAQPGDLLFYRLLQLDSHHNQQYHSMIVTGEHAQWAVYHTGPINAPNGQPGKGEIRRVLLRDLLHHPDPRWRPLASNANFLGVYRWDILAEGGSSFSR